MRNPIPLLAILLLGLVSGVPMVHGNAPCPTYEIDHDEPSVGVTAHANGAGQTKLDLFGGSFYVVFDKFEPVITYERVRGIDVPVPGYELSVWIYQEANAEPGLQRYDWYCATPGFESLELADWIVF